MVEPTYVERGKLVCVLLVTKVSFDRALRTTPHARLPEPQPFAV